MLSFFSLSQLNSIPAIKRLVISNIYSNGVHTKDYYFNINNLKYTSKLLFDLVSELIEK